MKVDVQHIEGITTRHQEFRAMMVRSVVTPKTCNPPVASAGRSGRARVDICGFDRRGEAKDTAPASGLRLRSLPRACITRAACLPKSTTGWGDVNQLVSGSGALVPLSVVLAKAIHPRLQASVSAAALRIATRWVPSAHRHFCGSHAQPKMPFDLFGRANGRTVLHTGIPQHVHRPVCQTTRRRSSSA